MKIDITFPGGKKVNAELGRHTVATDQPVEAGGDGSAPAPFEVFLASIGTCAGIYVLGFCQARGISAEGIRLTQHNDWDPVTGRLARVRLDIDLPASFPAKYADAVRRSAELCAVKKTIQNPPEFVVRTTVDSPARASA